ncbi:MAG: MerR family DNA-binding transcriptional regulator [Pseudomonadota bacterium]
MVKPVLQTQSRGSAIDTPSGPISDDAKEEGRYRIGDLAREFDVTLRTLRFYEDRGLLNPQRQGTTRHYSESDRERLQIALFGKRIGLSLGQISTILDLIERNGSDGPMAERIRTVYEQQLTVLEERAAETQNAIADLRDAIAKL